jgi:hypothetical protein
MPMQRRIEGRTGEKALTNIREGTADNDSRESSPSTPTDTKGQAFVPTT